MLSPHAFANNNMLTKVFFQLLVYSGMLIIPSHGMTLADSKEKRLFHSKLHRVSSATLALTPPRIWHNYRRKSTEGLPGIMLILWSICRNSSIKIEGFG